MTRSSRCLEAEGNYAIMKMIAQVFEVTFNPEEGKESLEWFDDPLAFDMAVKSINKVLKALRPEGEIPALSPLAGWVSEIREEANPAHVLERIKRADEALPIGDSRSKSKYARIKADLGKLADRLPEIVEGEPDDFLHVAKTDRPDERPVIVRPKRRKAKGGGST